MHSTDGKQQEKRHRIRHNELIDYPVDWNEWEDQRQVLIVCMCVCVGVSGEQERVLDR